MPKFIRDQYPGYQEVVDVDEDGFTVERKYSDTQDVLDHNQRVRNTVDKVEAKFGPDGERYWQVASIPQEIWAMMVKETNGEVLRDNALLMRLLRNPDIQKVLTTNKRF